MLTKQQEPLWGDEKTVRQIYGISRTPLYTMRKNGSVRSISLKAKGAQYGKRLFYLPSIEAFLSECELREKGVDQ